MVGHPSGYDDLLTCERCRGFYVVEASTDGGQPRVRCNACGHSKEASNASASSSSTSDSGKWTVIGPDGRARTYTSWEELAAARPSSNVDAPEIGSRPPEPAKVPAKEKRISGSSLLDTTPTPALPKLTLADLDSEPELVAAAPSAPSAEAPAPASDAPAVPTSSRTNDDDAAPLSLRDVISDAEPLSAGDVISESDAAPLSLRDVIPDHEDSDVPETVSLRDVAIVSSSAEVGAPADSTPAPPPRGVLRTLPPTPSKQGSAAPPPTIAVPEPPTSKARPKVTEDVKGSTSSDADDDAETTKLDPKPKKKARDGRDRSPTKAGATARRAAGAPAAARTDDDTPKRSWLGPGLAATAVAVVIWRVTAPPSTPPEPEPAAKAAPESPASPTAAESTIASTPTPDETPSPEATTARAALATSTPSAPFPSASTGDEEGETTTTPSATSSDPPAPMEKAAAPELSPTQTRGPEGPSMSDLLDRAGSARRSGEYATARDLYERVLRQNPRNVEANGGLGDVARAQGDLSRAKVSYERALAASPKYGPAQLGLADTEWDLGRRAAARSLYLQVVERLGDRAPERAKQRSSAEP